MFQESENLTSFYPNRPYSHAILPTILLLITPVFAVAQSTGSPEDAASSAANASLNRIERARALAAVHQLQAAATELENVRASSKDVTLRNVAGLMLLGIYLEDGNYGRSQSLLEEAFAGRAAQKDESMRTYFAAAGQTIIDYANGSRGHQDYEKLTSELIEIIAKRQKKGDQVSVHNSVDDMETSSTAVN